jgi:hypothetical protein
MPHLLFEDDIFLQKGMIHAHRMVRKLPIGASKQIMLTYSGYLRANIHTIEPPIDAPIIHIGSVNPVSSKN